MLLDSEHNSWLREHWTGGTGQRDRMSLTGGLRKTFKISQVEAQAAVKVFLQSAETDEDVVAILQQENAKRHARLKSSRISLICYWRLSSSMATSMTSVG